MTENILIIDDDPAMLDFLTQRLSVEGYCISTTSSSQDGFNHAITLQPDLILLDLRMPVRDGVTVCKLLRTNPTTQHIPIIVVTGILSPSRLREAMDSGADDFVSKPIDFTDLLIRIRVMLDSRTIADPSARFAHYHLEIVREAGNESSSLLPSSREE